MGGEGEPTGSGENGDVQKPRSFYPEGYARENDYKKDESAVAEPYLSAARAEWPGGGWWRKQRYLVDDRAADAEVD